MLQKKCFCFVRYSLKSTKIGVSIFLIFFLTSINCCLEFAKAFCFAPTSDSNAFLTSRREDIIGWNCCCYFVRSSLSLGPIYLDFNAFCTCDKITCSLVNSVPLEFFHASNLPTALESPASSIIILLQHISLLQKPLQHDPPPNHKNCQVQCLLNLFHHVIQGRCIFLAQQNPKKGKINFTDVLASLHQSFLSAYSVTQWSMKGNVFWGYSIDLGVSDTTCTKTHSYFCGLATV